MATDQLKSFIELIKFDQRFHTLNTQLKIYEDEVAQQDNTMREYDQQLEKIKRAVLDARKFVDEQELIMKELQAKEYEKKKHLDDVRNQKEFAALKKEITRLQEEQQEHERVLIDAWNKLETLQKNQDVKLKDVEEKRTELVAKRDEIMQKIQELKNEYEGHMGERDVLEKHVPEEWLEKYAVMRERVTNPVVPVMQNNCSSCFYAIPPQDMAALRNKKLIQCKDCYRLLYIE